MINAYDIIEVEVLKYCSRKGIEIGYIETAAKEFASNRTEKVKP